MCGCVWTYFLFVNVWLCVDLLSVCKCAVVWTYFLFVNVWLCVDLLSVCKCAVVCGLTFCL